MCWMLHSTVVMDSTSPVMITGVPVILYSIRNSLAPSVVQWRLSTYNVHCCEIRHLTNCQESRLNRKKPKPFQRNTDQFCFYHRTHSGLISLLSLTPSAGHFVIISPWSPKLLLLTASLARKQQQHFYGWLPNISYILTWVYEWTCKNMKLIHTIAKPKLSPSFSERFTESFKPGESR